MGTQCFKLLLLDYLPNTKRAINGERNLSVF